MKYKGLTLIETIIMIWVFSIGILTVLNLLSQSLYSLDNVKLRTQATLLAKEGIDLVYNMRDSNLKKELPWDCIVKVDIYTKNLERLGKWNPWSNQEWLGIFCESYFSKLSWDTNVLQIGFDKDVYIGAGITWSSEEFDVMFDSNKIYLHSWSISKQNMKWYSYDNDENAEETFFARYISFDEIKDWDSNSLSGWQILKVESNVLWRKGWATGHIVLESFVGDY